MVDFVFFDGSRRSCGYFDGLQVMDRVIRLCARLAKALRVDVAIAMVRHITMPKCLELEAWLGAELLPQGEAEHWFIGDAIDSDVGFPLVDAQHSSQRVRQQDSEEGYTRKDGLEGGDDGEEGCDTQDVEETDDSQRMAGRAIRRARGASSQESPRARASASPASRRGREHAVRRLGL